MGRIRPPAEGEPQGFVDLAFPIDGPGGRRLGVLGAHLAWQWAREIGRSVTGALEARRRVDALIVDARGRVLLGPPELQGQIVDIDSLRRARAQRGAGHVLERWPDGSDYVVGFARTAGHADYPGLGWTVLLRQDADNAYAPVRKLGSFALWTGLALALLFSIAGVLVANWITRPITQLQHYADRIRLGSVTPLAPDARSYGEVRSLAGALDSLVAELMRRGRELEELNRTLEQRVGVRTHELAKALATVQQNAQHINTIIETAKIGRAHV